MSDVTFTYVINNNGKKVGLYASGGAYGEGMCFPVDSKIEDIHGSSNQPVVKKVKVKKAPPAPVKVAVKKESRHWLSKLLWGSKSSPVRATGCGSDGTVAPGLADSGVPFVSPDAGAEGDADYVETDAGVILPEAVLPGSVFDIDGNGGFFQSTPSILLETPILQGQGLQNLELYVEKGTDSTYLTYDNDGDGTLESTMGCFDGLINMNQLSSDALALTPEERELYGITSCGETGYESFVVCPQDAGNRIKLYLGEYTLENYKYNSATEQYELQDTLASGILTDPEQLFSDLTSGVALPVVCDSGETPYEVSLPSTWNSDGTIYFKLKLKLIADARNADASADYKTQLSVKLKAEEE